MAKFAIYAHMKAKPGKAAELEAFLKSALPLAEDEHDLRRWRCLVQSANEVHHGSAYSRRVFRCPQSRDEYPHIDCYLNCMLPGRNCVK